jgi:hypothetical protein
MANPTSNYGWVLPNSADLVTDLPADFDVALQGVDTTTKALNPATTLGDIQYRSSTANTNTRLGIGSTGQVLTVAGGVPSWASPAGSSGPAFSARNNTSQSVTSATYTKVTFDTELFDTDNCFASNRFTPNKAGYYQINAMVQGINNTANTLWIMAYKNGSFDRYLARFDSLSAVGAGSPFLMYFNGSSDYLEIFVYLGGTTPEVAAKSFFDGVWIRG